ncbi:MAG: alpha/beta hydrolase [Saprospiraceae bacterium]|nr:alpha/beta hydrolase [Saprospiraceae bacterium]
MEKGLDIYYESAGSGSTTLLFIHGLGTTGKSWQRVMPPLAEHFTCIAPDLPGYGKSTKSDFPFTIDFFKNSLLLLIEKLGLDQIVLVGHSMGGQIAASMVLENPDVFKGLILMAPAGFETFTREGGDLIKQWYTPEILSDLSPEQVRRNFEANFSNTPPELESMIAERLSMMQSDEYSHFSRMIPKCVQGMLDQPVFEDYKNIHLPVLTFFGLEDKLIPSPLLRRKLNTREIAEKGIAQFPKGQLKLIPNCGHFIPLDCPMATIQPSINFIKNIRD